MPDIIPFTPPDFLQNQDEETIYQRIKSNAPSDLDTSEGSFFWDVTRPVAIEEAEILEFKLIEAFKNAFPQWSYGQYLDMQAEMVGLKRKEATKATGIVHVTGTPGTIINQGFTFATPAYQDTPSILFQAKQQYVIPSEGAVDVEVEAVEAGPAGNVAANTITIMTQPISGITSVTNPSATIGGVAEEDDESLRSRILEASQYVPLSGSINDYKIWAKQVDGVGDVYVEPEWNGPGTVKLILIDSNGQPASEALINTVKNHIAPGNGTGLAPIGATVTFVAPTSYTIDYRFSLTLQDGYDLTDVINKIKAALDDYYKTVGVGGKVVYSKVIGLISTIQGVADVSNLTINGGISNIQLASDEYPSTGTVTNV